MHLNTCDLKRMTGFPSNLHGGKCTLLLNNWVAFQRVKHFFFFIKINKKSNLASTEHVGWINSVLQGFVFHNDFTILVNIKNTISNHATSNEIL